MMSHRIFFHCSDVKFTLRQKTILRQWIDNVCNSYQKPIAEINFIFCSDEYLLKINQSFLAHDYYTDIITFDNSSKQGIAVEAYISIERVRENSQELRVPFLNELHRVMIHGVLHAIGFKDKSIKKAKEMRIAEDHALSVLTQMITAE